MKLFKILLSLAILASSALAFGQVTGLSGWDIYVDPGHSQHENMGIYNYSEAEKNLGVALNLRELLLTTTDIDTVYMSRTNSQVLVGLTQRINIANSLGASWYHSIHSDAGSSSYNSTLLLWGQLYNGQPDPPVGGEAMADIMVDKLTRGMRIPTRGSIGDCSFYTWSDWCAQSGGPYLAVNRLSDMPSELSEAGFHTNPTQNQRNMSAKWKRMEAYTFYWSILQDRGIARPQVGILNGIIKDADTHVPINGATVSVEGLTDTTDTYASLFHQYSTDPTKLHNGFYFIEGLSSGTHQVIFNAPGHYPDTLQVTMVDTFFTFQDVNLVSSIPPFVVETTPAEGDTNFPAWDPIVVDFSRPMDRNSVENALSLSPEVNGNYTWSSGDTRLSFVPDTTLQFLSNYTLTIDASAGDTYGHPIDGNADSTGGDPYTLHFRTGPEDMSPPEFTASYPATRQANIELRPIITLTYDEQIDSTSLDASMFVLQTYSDNVDVPGEFRHYIVRDHSVISFFPSEDLQPNTTYVFFVNPGMRDLQGNEQTHTRGLRFDTGDQYSYNETTIDNFDAGVDNWWDPEASGSTSGTVGDGTNRLANSDIVNLLSSSTNSMQLDYQWDMEAGSWLLREYLGGGAPRDVQFDASYFLQVYIFGDGSGTQFRFAVDDHVPNESAGNHEVSPWYTIDWYGWRLVTWDMLNDGTGTWLGDGNLDGTLRFDSIQLTYADGAATSGTLYFDDLRLVDNWYTGVQDEGNVTEIPETYQLGQNYPNPFNPTTSIRYQIPSRDQVQLNVYNLRGELVKSLVNEYQSAGYHTVTFSADDLPSGIYIYRIVAGNFTKTRKMSLIK